MNEQYSQFLHTMSSAVYLPTSPDEMGPYFMPGLPLPFSTPPMQSPHPSHGNGYFAGYTQGSVINVSKPSKSRRRSAASQGGNADQVKHRRTRSGCYMCRSRRVKASQKSKRASGHSTATRPREGSSTQHISPASSNDVEEEDTEQEARLGTIPDDDEPDVPPRRTSMSEGHKSASPSTSTATTGSWTPAGYQGTETTMLGSGSSSAPGLPQDLRSYLLYFRENMTNYHYGLAVDEDDFFNSELPTVALQCEPLLNALVGFAAYHITLRNPNGELKDFLQYYNKGVTQLLRLLKNGTCNVHVLLTILQLATIEEYLGDWVNLMGHQKAAYEVLIQLYTPQTVMATSIGRMCLSWYARFDNIVALMGRIPTEIPRVWFTNMISYYQTQMASHPKELRWRIEDRSARLRLISWDMSSLYARGSAQTISKDDYANEHNMLSAQLEEWKANWDPLLCDQQFLVTDFNWRLPLNSDDIVDPYRPGLLYDHPLFNNTIITMEWHSIVIMHKTQSPDISNLAADLATHSFTVCEIFECLEFWPDLPPGTLIAVQPCLAIAALFLPHEPNNNMWLRRKFALLETQGHINPVSRREKMAQVFNDPSCVRWWLPNDEFFTPILQSIRAFADDRNAKALNMQQESIREVKHLFDKLSL
ncbi:hypothetical protein BBK36DRAFT_1174954 [Trichoderma citrinoviride]|uniref:C6 finger domain protein n=1 Tax=Trichoderma citrinoviride TaxID=58853 RepID=A0A2T4BMT8_9HYPO|nr:hypothetical protein BBK36DRAFT_1174954 [Trichoderma citrinoviride]PTB70628.1 hypothetical protein BBK36DRAFT_1174954 [Trichoderma citrinoviride]